MKIMSTQSTAVATGHAEIRGPITGRYAEILSKEAVEFLTSLATTFEPRRQELLAKRKVRQQQLDSGAMPDFLPETASIRSKEWTVAPIPKDLQDRRVEITGPVDRKMIINALNSGASVFMADFEDANSPTWTNNLDGQVNLGDAIRRTITFESPEGKSYKLNDKTATLLVRPRGWHLNEKHFWSTARRSPVRSSISVCISSTTPRSWSRAAPVRTSICRRWRAISKRVCGTTCSTSRRTRSASRAAPSAPRC